MSKAKVLIHNNQKDIKVPVGIRLLIRRSCTAVLTYENFPSNAEVSVSFVNDKQIHELNLKYRNMDKPTDVLSFPLGDGKNYDKNPETGDCLLGDIVISLETAERQALIYNHSLEREIGFLTVHSMFHLLGYDHETSNMAALIMREKEEAVLSELGISRNTTFEE